MQKNASYGSPFRFPPHLYPFASPSCLLRTSSDRPLPGTGGSIAVALRARLHTVGHPRHSPFSLPLKQRSLHSLTHTHFAALYCCCCCCCWCFSILHTLTGKPSRKKKDEHVLAIALFLSFFCFSTTWPLSGGTWISSRGAFAYFTFSL